ncbi:hypothetical protein HDU76_010707, partial [Blyttiomyces sp. JEL0837]
MPNYIIREATPAQYRASLEAHYQSWGAPYITLDDYIRREEHLEAQQFSNRPGGPPHGPGSFGNTSGCSRRGWVLVPEDDIETTDILSSCESYSRPGTIITRPSSSDSKPTVTHGTIYSIASVYTPTQHRRKGYANTLLTKLLHEKFKSDPEFIGSNLYSDVYECGTFEVDVGVWAKNAVEKKKDGHIVNDLTDGELSSLMKDDLNMSIDRMMKDSLEGKGLSSKLLIHPEYESVMWLVARSRYYLASLSSSMDSLSGKTFDVIGGSISNADGTKRGYALWCIDYRKKEMTIVRFECDKD